jgi:hypothetical protein
MLLMPVGLPSVLSPCTVAAAAPQMCTATRLPSNQQVPDAAATTAEPTCARGANSSRLPCCSQVEAAVVSSALPCMRQLAEQLLETPPPGMPHQLKCATGHTGHNSGFALQCVSTTSIVGAWSVHSIRRAAPIFGAAPIFLQATATATEDQALQNCRAVRMPRHLSTLAAYFRAGRLFSTAANPRTTA